MVETSCRSRRYAKTVRSLGLALAAPAGSCPALPGTYTRPVEQITSGPKRSQEAPGREIGRMKANESGKNEVTSFSYLPTTFATLFFLAASLLLGYIQ
jgi:hypothetical protein